MAEGGDLAGSNPGGSGAAGYWRDMALDKVLPGLVTNLLTALAVWLAAVATGYVRRPSALVLGVLVLVLGVTGLLIAGSWYLRPSPVAAPRGRTLSLASDTFGLVLLVAFFLYSFSRRALGPEWILVVTAFGPAVIASILGELLYWRGLGTAQDASRAVRRRHRVRTVGVMIMVVAAAAWWGLAWSAWSGVSAQPGMVLVVLGLTYLLAHDREGNRTQIPWRRYAVIAIATLLVVYTSYRVGTGR